MDSPSFVQKVIDAILSILPLSPLRPVIDQMETVSWLGYVNYFIPVGTFITIGSAWLVAIGIYYLYQVILRWAKVIS